MRVGIYRVGWKHFPPPQINRHKMDERRVEVKRERPFPETTNGTQCTVWDYSDKENPKVICQILAKLYYQDNFDRFKGRVAAFLKVIDSIANNNTEIDITVTQNMLVEFITDTMHNFIKLNDKQYFEDVVNHISDKKQRESLWKDYLEGFHTIKVN